MVKRMVHLRVKLGKLDAVAQMYYITRRRITSSSAHMLLGLSFPWEVTRLDSSC